MLLKIPPESVLDKVRNVFKQMGGKVSFLFREEQTDLSWLNQFTETLDLTHLKEQARKAGMANQPLPQSLISSAISSVKTQRNAFQQAFDQKMPGLLRNKQALLSYCAAKLDENGSIIEEVQPSPVTVEDIYQRLNPQDRRRG